MVQGASLYYVPGAGMRPPLHSSSFESASLLEQRCSYFDTFATHSMLEGGGVEEGIGLILILASLF